MGSWEDELDLDLSDIWAAGSKPEQGGTKPREGAGAQERAEEDGGDDLAFPTQAAAPHVSQPALQGEPETRVAGLQTDKVVTRLQSENGVTPLLNADVADAPTQVASLTAEPYISRGGSTVPLATQTLVSRGNGGSKQRLPPLPSFQPVQTSSREGSTVPIATQSLASRENDPKQRLGSSQVPGFRNPNSREKGSQQPRVDIRRYFTQGGSSSGADGGGPRKKPRIPGPVGDLFQKEQRDEGDVVEGDGHALGAREDDFNDRVFRKGAWISALQSLNVEEFDPARYAILKVTASSIGSSRIHQHVPHFVAVIKELTPNVFGDAAVILKDPTGTVEGMMNNKVFSNTDYARAISPGAVIVLKQVAVFSPSAHYLNITINNVVQVFPANTDFPQGSAPKPRRQQEPLSQQEQPPQPRPRSQPKPQPSPPQQEQPPPQPRSPLPSQPLPLQPPQPRSQPRPIPSPSPLRQGLQLPQSQPRQPQSPPRPPQEPTKAPHAIAAAAKTASWDLLSPSPPREPSAPQEPKAPEGIAAAAKTARWDLLSPSPSPPREPSPPQEPKAPEGIAAAAKMAGWGDLTDDMEALLNEDVDDFYK